MPTKVKDAFNANTVLCSIIIMISAATLSEVKEQAKLVAALAARVQNLERIVYSIK